MRTIGGFTSARRPCDVSIDNGLPSSGFAFAKKRCSPKRCWRSYGSRCPLDSRSMCSVTVGMPPIACSNSAAVSAGMSCVRSNPIGSWTTRNSPNGPKRSRHQRYQRVQLTATDQRQRTYLVRTRQGKLNTVPFEVCVLISQRHHRDTHPKYFLCTDLALSAQQILSIYQKRWPIEVDNF